VVGTALGMVDIMADIMVAIMATITGMEAITTIITIIIMAEEEVLPMVIMPRIEQIVLDTVQEILQTMEAETIM
jgi:hypothetical protein